MNKAYQDSIQKRNAKPEVSQQSSFKIGKTFESPDESIDKPDPEVMEMLRKN